MDGRRRQSDGRRRGRYRATAVTTVTNGACSSNNCARIDHGNGNGDGSHRADARNGTEYEDNGRRGGATETAALASHRRREIVSVLRSVRYSA